MMRFLKVLFAIAIVLAIVVGVVYWVRRHPRPEPVPAPPFETQGKLQIFALDVGQGDGLLIVSPGGKTVLIDAGSARVAQSVRLPAALLADEVLQQLIVGKPRHPQAPA